MKNKSRGFTLVEVLVVLAIISIISVVVVLTLNPAELLRQSRDSARLSDVSTLHNAMGAYLGDLAGTLGSSSVVYASLSDASSTCSNLGLPALTTSTGQSYQCASSTSRRGVAGTGWIPLNFSSISEGSPINTLPIDPMNQTSSGLYYTYSTNGSQYVLTAIMESQKYRFISTPPLGITNYPSGADLVGTNLTISPLFNLSGLVSYWPLDESTGTVVYDYSGNNASGTWLFTPPFWAKGKYGLSGGYSSGNSNLSIPTAAYLPTSTITVTAWVNVKSNNANYFNFVTNNWQTQEGGWDLFSDSSGITYFGVYHASSSYYATGCPAFGVGSWHFVTGVYDGNTIKAYVDGSPCTSPIALAGETLFNSLPWIIAANNTGAPYSIDDVRVYNRVLSPAEIQAFYNSQK